MPSGSNIVIFVFVVVFLLSPAILLLYLLYFSRKRKSGGVDKSLSTKRSEALLAASNSTKQFLSELEERTGLHVDFEKVNTSPELFGDIVSQFAVSFNRGPLWRNNSISSSIRYSPFKGNTYRLWTSHLGYKDYSDSTIDEYFSDINDALNKQSRSLCRARTVEPLF